MKFEDIKWMAKFPEVQTLKNPMFDTMRNVTCAKIEFNNGYGVSLLCGEIFYSNGVDTYECAVTYKNGLCYATWITNDVMGYLSKEELMQTIYEVEKLCAPSKDYKFRVCSIAQKLRRVWSYQMAPFLKWISVYQIQRLQTWFNSYFRSPK